MELARRQAMVPPGFRFAPTRQELIRSYLDPWAAGRLPAELLATVVCAADVYGADPATLTSRHQSFGHDDGKWYFLCVARRKDGGGTRMNRSVEGGGKWHGSGRRIPVGGYGHRQTFEYRDAGGKKTAWLMEEFASSLPAGATGGEDGVKVLCRVYRTPRAAAADDGDDEGEHQAETNRAVGSKKRRRTPQQEHGGSAAADSTATDGGCSSYASAYQAPPASTNTWQQSTEYDCNAGVAIKNEQEPEPLAMVTGGDMVWPELPQMYYGSGFTGEDAHLNNDWLASIFTCPEPSDGDKQDDVPKRDTAAG